MNFLDLHPQLYSIFIEFLEDKLELNKFYIQYPHLRKYKYIYLKKGFSTFFKLRNLPK